MDRRWFVSTAFAAFVVPKCGTRAKQGAGMPRIGLLMGYPQDHPDTPTNIAAFHEGLRRAGLEPGRTAHIEHRWAGVDPVRARTLARELIALKPDVIVGSTNQVVTILKQETQSIPIIFVFIGDPIGSGYAATIAKPGFNLTGFSNFEAPIGGKWLEMLKEIAPTLTRVGFVYHPSASPHVQFLKVAEATAPGFGLQLTAIPVISMDEIRQKLSAFAAIRGGGIVVAPHALTLGGAELITSLAAQNGLPAIYGDRYFMRSGGLMCFGISMADQLLRAGGYVDLILKGVKPGALPVQLPTRYDTVINMRTAKAMGLTVPATLLARVDELIE